MVLPAGTSFDSDGFRAGIKFAMTMGAAPEASEQVTFHFATTATNTAPVDGSGVPFDPDARPTRITPATKRVDCAVEYFDANGQPTSFGILSPSSVGITLLDEDYEQVKGCAFITIAGDRYNYHRTVPPAGMFDVGVYEMRFRAENET